MEKQTFSWGSKETQYFFELTPERILSAVEAFGYKCTGRSLALNSMENARFKVDVRVSEPTLREVYLPHFKPCVDEDVAAL